MGGTCLGRFPTLVPELHNRKISNLDGQARSGVVARPIYHVRPLAKLVKLLRARNCDRAIQKCSRQGIAIESVTITTDASHFEHLVEISFRNAVELLQHLQ